MLRGLIPGEGWYKKATRRCLSSSLFLLKAMGKKRHWVRILKTGGKSNFRNLLTMVTRISDTNS